MIQLHHQFAMPVTGAVLVSKENVDCGQLAAKKRLDELESTLNSMLATLADVRSQQQQMENERGQHSVRLALQIARGILGHEAQHSTEKLQAKLDELIAQNQQQEQIEIRLNEADLDAMNLLESNSKTQKHVRFVADSNTDQGDFLFIMDDQVVVQNRQWQLNEIELKLMEAFSNE